MRGCVNQQQFVGLSPSVIIITYYIIYKKDHYHCDSLYVLDDLSRDSFLLFACAYYRIGSRLMGGPIKRFCNFPILLKLTKHLLIYSWNNFCLLIKFISGRLVKYLLIQSLITIRVPPHRVTG